MVYKIECVLKELNYNTKGKLIEIQIKGCEGYLLKQGEKEYNVFRPEIMPQVDSTASKNAEILCAETYLKLGSAPIVSLSQILVQAKCANKKVRLEICGDSGTIGKSIDPNKINIQSVVIL